MVRVLVTGGAGFVGSWFARALLADEYADLACAHVTVLDSLAVGSNVSNLASVAGCPRFDFVHGDIAAVGDLDDVVPGHDVIVNFAVAPRLGVGATECVDLIRANVFGVQQLLSAALRHRVTTVLQVSTDEVYGTTVGRSWTEDDVAQPNSAYAASKAAGDLVTGSYAQAFGLDARVARCVASYGPYQSPDEDVARIVTNLLDGVPVRAEPDELPVRGRLWVGDTCRALAAVLARGAAGEVYNIGAQNELGGRALVDRVAELVDADPRLSRRAGDAAAELNRSALRYSVDASRIAALGFLPRMTLAEGLSHTVRWYRANRAWWRPLTERVAR